MSSVLVGELRRVPIVTVRVVILALLVSKHLQPAGEGNGTGGEWLRGCLLRIGSHCVLDHVRCWVLSNEPC